MEELQSQQPWMENKKKMTESSKRQTNVCGRERLASIHALLLVAIGYAIGSAAPQHLHAGGGQQGTVRVSGTVTQGEPFCGGTPPPDVVSSPLNAAPFPNKTFHVTRGTTHALGDPIVGRFTSDSTGRFSIRLAPGTYSILVDEQIAAPDVKRYEARFVKMDEACFKDWWAKPYSTLHVGTSDISGLQFHFDHRCFIKYDIPCLHYVGPPPP
jgi:hypothetical protein